MERRKEKLPQKRKKLDLSGTDIPTKRKNIRRNYDFPLLSGNHKQGKSDSSHNVPRGSKHPLLPGAKRGR